MDLPNIFDAIIAKPETTKVYRWGEKNPVFHIPSQASTSQAADVLAKLQSAASDAALKVDYSKLHAKVDMPADLVCPPDGGYPFYEYSDFDADERGVLLGCRVAWALARMPKDILTANASRWLAHEVADIGARMDEDQWEATELCAAQLLEAVARSEEERERLAEANKGPKPARAGHLMAEGRAMAVAREAAADKRYTRKVTFDEPVNAFTMLHGDNLARGGDMLTAVTVTSTEEHQIKDFAGRPKTVYTSWAVSI